jgi:hypothetical protein
MTATERAWRNAAAAMAAVYVAARHFAAEYELEHVRPAAEAGAGDHSGAVVALPRLDESISEANAVFHRAAMLEAASPK